MDQRQRNYIFQGDRILLGKGRDCDLCLAGEPVVALEHLLLFREGESWYAEDLFSIYGTTLNGVKLNAHKPMPLRDQDCVVLAGYVRILMGISEGPGIMLLAERVSGNRGDIRWFRRYSEAEEQALWARAARNDPDAKQDLLEAYYHLVEDVVEKCSSRDWERQDLIYEGFHALVQAMERFDWHRDHFFSNYAYGHIYHAVHAARQRHEEELSACGPGDEFAHTLYDVQQEAPTSGTELAEALGDILDTLTEREADVLCMRFGLYDGCTRTQEEVGQIFGVTHERIRQIENKAIRKLRHSSRAKRIRDFYEDPDRTGNKYRHATQFLQSVRDRRRKQMDDIQFRAAAPGELKAGQYFLVKLMAYRESDYERADREQRSLGDRVAASSSGIFEAAVDQTFHIKLRSEDFDMEEKLLTLTWNGKYASTQADILLPADFAGEQVRLVARVSTGIQVLTDLILILQVHAAQPQDVPAEKRPIKTAFASYASPDRDKVLARIQGLLLGREDLDIFLDKKDMVPGEYWEQRLYQEIDARDVFYLFWSNNARQSPWVQKELAHAIAKKGSWFIHPVALEDPSVCPPPEQLQDRHFGDWTLYYMKG